MMCCHILVGQSSYPCLALHLLGSVSEHKFQQRKRFSARKEAKFPARPGKRKI